MKYNSFLKPFMVVVILVASSVTLYAQNNYEAQIAAIMHRLDSIEQILAEAGIGADDATRTVMIDNGALPGVFSVSDKQKVRFSMGNLQYQASTGLWRFAKNQYSYAGKTNSKASPTYSGWIDLFVWGTSGYHDNGDKENIHYQPYSTSTEQYEQNTHNAFGYGPSTNMKSADLTGKSAEYDWGVHNSISNGGEKAGLWRTLTNQEWDYVLNKRSTEMRYCMATVGDYAGVILFPDSFSMPSGVPQPQVVNFGTEYKFYTLTKEQWNSMEAAGAVFLPAAGYRAGTTTDGQKYDGYYWSSTHENQDYAFRLAFGDGYIGANGTSGRFDAFAVRLVRAE
ncbi:MAG: hypothetical protein IJU90_05750 [Bacteroidales bacterium]|nr:hypothetical protein [Bacteroidales bacterium]